LVAGIEAVLHSRVRRCSLVLILAAGAGVSWEPSACAAPPSASAAVVPHVVVENAWIPQPPPGAEVAAAYFTVRNPGPTSVVLTDVESSLADAAMLHESLERNGQAEMRPVERLTIAPGQRIVLMPGGLHVMLHGLHHPLAVGERVPLTLRFAGGSVLAVVARVRPLGSS
jgi:periplasmic copper chaperone A